jgi:hypothetical protein
MTKAHEELVDFIAGGTTPQTVLSFQPSQDTRDRVHALVRKEKESGLGVEEKIELDNYLQLEHLMRMAKARARKLAV